MKLLFVIVIFFCSFDVQGEIVQRNDGTWVQIPDSSPPSAPAKHAMEDLWNSGLADGKLTSTDTLVHWHDNPAECLGGLLAARKAMGKQSYVVGCYRTGNFAFVCSTYSDSTIKFYCTKSGALYCDKGQPNG